MTNECSITYNLRSHSFYPSLNLWLDELPLHFNCLLAEQGNKKKEKAHGTPKKKKTKQGLTNTSEAEWTLLNTVSDWQEFKAEWQTWRRPYWVLSRSTRRRTKKFMMMSLRKVKRQESEEICSLVDDDDVLMGNVVKISCVSKWSDRKSGAICWECDRPVGKNGHLSAQPFFISLSCLGRSHAQLILKFQSTAIPLLIGPT
jgi:hypothetical protein